MLVTQSRLTLCDPLDCSPPDSSDRFPGKNGGVPSPPPGDLTNPGIKPMSPVAPATAGRFFTTAPPGKPLGHSITTQKACRSANSNREVDKGQSPGRQARKQGSATQFHHFIHPATWVRQCRPCREMGRVWMMSHRASASQRVLIPIRK